MPYGTRAQAKTKNSVGMCGRRPSVEAVRVAERGERSCPVSRPERAGERAEGAQRQAEAGISAFRREAALLARIPCVTTVSGAAAAVEAIARATRGDTVSLQERVAESA